MGSLLILAVPPGVFHVSAASSYAPGVKQADSITYGNVASFWRANFTRTSSPPPTATISVQPNATIDLSRSMKQITVELALNNTPDVPPFNAISVQLSYDHHALSALSLDFSTNVLSQTGFSTFILRDCLDGAAAPGQGLDACSVGDGPGTVTFAETMTGDTSDGTQGNIFFLTFNVNTTAPHFSQIRIVQTILGEGRVSIPTTNIDGYYTSLSCGGAACLPGHASFAWSPLHLKPGDIVSFNASSSLPSPGAVITDYFWAFGDEANLRPFQDSGTNSTTAHSYQLPGNYSTTLTITDSNGVKTSQTRVIEIIASIPIGAPPFIAEFLGVQSIQVGVQSVAGNNVSISQTFFFKNITVSRTMILSGDVASGSGNLAFWLISTGLTTGSQIYNTPGSPSINSTDPEIIEGVLRQVVHLDLTVNAGTVRLNWVWDQATGILLSFDSKVLVQTGASVSFGNSSASMTGTDVFLPASSPIFSLSVSPSLLTISGNSNLTSSFAITLTSRNNFAGGVLVGLEVSPCCLGVPAGPLTMVLNPNGTSSKSIDIFAGLSTVSGTYYVTVTASLFVDFPWQATTLTVVVLPTRDFLIEVNPSSLTVHKSSSTDPSAVASSTVTLTSLGGFSGTILFGANIEITFPIPNPSNPPDLGLTITPPAVSLAANSTATANVTLTAANSPPGLYLITVRGRQQFLNGTFGTLSHTASLRVQVTGPPPDFGISISSQFGNNVIFAGSDTTVEVQLDSLQLFNGTVSLTGQAFPVVNNGPTLSINPPTVRLFGFAASQLTMSTTGLTPPGNYTITVTGTSGPLVHTDQLILTVLPPPILTVSPSSGPVGTFVRVHGSGFVTLPNQGPPSVPIEIQMTFDDQLTGLFFIQGSSFNFTFNVPVSQAGIVHQIHAKELFPLNLDIQTSFLVTLPPTVLRLSVSTGTIYFQGDTATIFVSTSLDGQATSVSGLQIILVRPNGSNTTLTSVQVSPGYYKAAYLVPSSGAFGTYAVVVTARQTGSNAQSALTTFEVKPTWLQSNGHTVTATTSVAAVAGALGLVALAWRKGYFSRKRDDFPGF